MSEDHLVSFPTSESTPEAPLPVLHLPYRRISLPSTPSLPVLTNRQSVVSLTSSASLAEQDPTHHRRGKRRSLKPSTRSRTCLQVDEARDARRKKIISEFYDTEKSYVDGLDLVYSHFLTPILASLDTSNPLLTRHEISTLFSNFIDIWNFHRTFFAAFTALVHPPPSSPSISRSVSVSSLFLAHFPYLSLYTPFIIAFPASVTLLSLLSQNHSSNPAFANFLRVQESHPICAHLRLADYLLTPVQRCPRYLLLLKDLLEATHPDDSEWTRLQEVYDLVAKITASLNTSLTTHAQTLALLSIQRNTRDLPPIVIPLVAPGRILLKRGMLVREFGTGDADGRALCEFILLNDYLLCLEREELGFLPQSIDGTPQQRRQKHAGGDSGDDNKWIYRGIVNLVDMEVVMGFERMGGGIAPQERLEILSPEGSFALYTACATPNPEDPNSLESWISALRTARATRLTQMALFNPDSTLSASASSIHVRRALKAFAVDGVVDGDFMGSRAQNNVIDRLSGPAVRRAHIDNFLPPVWVPDAKTDVCMKCGRSFGFVLDLRLADVFGRGSRKDGRSENEMRLKVENERGAWRRKHHCRLCGQVVCAACSSKTFYIVDTDSGPSQNKSKAKPARACEKCYEEAFPIIIGALPRISMYSTALASSAPFTPGYDRSSTQMPITHSSTLLQSDVDHESIEGIQPWHPISSGTGVCISEALMAMDLTCYSRSGATSDLQKKAPSLIGLSSTPSNLASNDSYSTRPELNGAGNESSSNTLRLSANPSRVNAFRELHLRDQQPSLSPNSSPNSSPFKRTVPLPLHTSRGVWKSSPDDTSVDAEINMWSTGPEGSSISPVRIRPRSTRPRSFYDILEDFNLSEGGLSAPSSVSSRGLGSVQEGDDEIGDSQVEADGDDVRRVMSAFRIQDRVNSEGNHGSSFAEMEKDVGESDKFSRPREDTARRRKRISLPAIALQTAPVFARAKFSRKSSSRTAGWLERV